MKPGGFIWEPTQYGVFNDPSPSTFQENVWIKVKKYLVCKLPKTDREGRGKGSKAIRNPLTLASTFFLTAARLHRALFVVSKAVIKVLGDVSRLLNNRIGKNYI